MKRRDLFLLAASGMLPAASTTPSSLAVEGYIFQQYAERTNKSLRDGIGEVLPMARKAGFRNIELSPSFFLPEMREQLISLLRSERLAMPSVYVGGPMHENAGADRTIASALVAAKFCAPFGCKAVVSNPDPKPADAPKTEEELIVQAGNLDRMGRVLAEHGFDLRVHHHTPQLENNAREWRHILQNTNPAYVHICVDVDWAYEAGFEPVPFLKQVGTRLREIHVRSARNKLWLEDVEDSDIDYSKVAAYLQQAALAPLIVVELAYRPNTVVTRTLQEDLRLSRIYTERVFGVHTNA